MKKHFFSNTFKTKKPSYKKTMKTGLTADTTFIFIMIIFTVSFGLCTLYLCYLQSLQITNLTNTLSELNTDQVAILCEISLKNKELIELKKEILFLESLQNEPSSSFIRNLHAGNDNSQLYLLSLGSFFLCVSLYTSGSVVFIL